MSNGTDGVRRLPDEVFASHGRRPNPSSDEHVAFPDDADAFGSSAPDPPAGLLPSAWAPAPGETPHAWPTLHRRRGLWRFIPDDPGTRRRRVKQWLAVLVLGGMLYSGGQWEVDGEAPATSGYGYEMADTRSDGMKILDIVPVELGGPGTILPADQQTTDLPSASATVRIEVVSDDPSGGITITAADDTVMIGDTPLPFAAELALTEPPDRLSVSVRSGSGDSPIQCRVYADGFLVAIGTGAGSATCVAKPSG